VRARQGTFLISVGVQAMQKQTMKINAQTQFWGTEVGDKRMISLSCRHIPLPFEVPVVESSLNHRF
jgi:hypothetical protein